MAMLAETRRKKSYTLVPKGKALYEDGDRFGTKMLEKMGWSKGKGLGANEDGEKDFVRIRYKRDNEGFGFEARNDQWTQHEKDFTGLLKNLHGENDVKVEEEADTPSVGFGFQGTQTKESMKAKLTGKSLVEMSKTSRARVHYQKFARGKDLSRASEKDLANIFGRKAPTEDNIFSAFQAVDNTEKEEEKQEEEPKQEKKQEGVQIVNTGISISDYFKQKMEALKLKRAGGNSSEQIPSKKIKSEDSESGSGNSDSEKSKKKKKKDKEEVEAEPQSVSEETIIEKPKKKKKKSKEVEEIPKEIEQPSEEKPKKKKKKEIEEEPLPTEDKPKKKKKKSKESEIPEEPTPETESSEKPKKKKNKESEPDPVPEEPQPKKKKKKSELVSENQPPSDETSPQVPPTDQQPISEKEAEDGEGEWQQVKSTKEKKLVTPPEEPQEQFDPTMYRINSYVAEKFRNIDMPAFSGSNISQFKGYGLDQIEKLEVYTREIDDFKIKEFWKKDLVVFDDNEYREEYIHIGSHSKSANELLKSSKYKRKAFVAWKEKKKVPNLDLSAIKKRRAFTGI